MLVIHEKRRTSIVNYAEERMKAVKAIDAVPNFGNDLTAENLEKLIKEYDEQCIEHNNAAAVLAELTLKLKATENSIERIADRLLDAVAAKYGRNSPEFKLVNSVKKNPQKVGKAKSKAKPQDTVQPEVTKPEATKPEVVQLEVNPSKVDQSEVPRLVAVTSTVA